MAIEQDFNDAFCKWKEELERDTFNSNSTQFRTSENFKKIVSLGKNTVPFIIDKLSEGYFFLNHVIQEITRIDIKNLKEISFQILSEQDISKLWIEWWNTNKKIPKISSSIAPWVLPKEEIPMYVYLNKLTSLSKIKIELPECCDVIETINVLEKQEKEKIIEISKIGETPYFEKNYFGLVLQSNKIFDDLAIKTPIKITLVETDGTEEEHIVHAKIFRPRMEINQIPTKISIIENEETVLPIHLKYQGFGDVSIRIEGTIGGDIVTEGGRMLMDTVFYGLMKEGIVDEEYKEKTESGIVVNKEKLLNLIDEFKDQLKDPAYIEKFEKDKEVTQESVEWLKSFNEGEQEKFMNVLYDTVETYLIKKITDLVSKNVSNKTHLDSGTKISTTIQTQITNLHMKIFYIDLKGNVYAPLETDVKIVDKRKNIAPIRVTIPIEIEKVDETEAYKNVEEMPIGISV